MGEYTVAVTCLEEVPNTKDEDPQLTVPPRKVMEPIELQLRNALAPIDVTLDGIVIEVRDAQL